ncbi:hypothetical protein PAPYR_6407 [Paratrimastix pyriformis]|uniref:Uncharacterized protein n=1 Tax=Paratrimastix pyriformis TaxID=342808 RepID=A0ABQ8UFF9_9EUKA|nr:hypothetical protein PAPYR_6407 [Paratrimastix pyriformis]
MTQTHSTHLPRSHPHPAASPPHPGRNAQHVPTPDALCSPLPRLRTLVPTPDALCIPLPGLRKLAVQIAAHRLTYRVKYETIATEALAQGLCCLAHCPALERCQVEMLMKTHGMFPPVQFNHRGPWRHRFNVHTAPYRDLLLTPLDTLFAQVPTSLTVLQLPSYLLVPIETILASAGLHGLVRCEAWIEAHDGPLVEQWLDQCPDLECVWLKRIPSALLPRLLASMRQPHIRQDSQQSMNHPDCSPPCAAQTARLSLSPSLITLLKLYQSRCPKLLANPVRELALDDMMDITQATDIRVQSPTLECLSLQFRTFAAHIAIADCPALREATVHTPSMVVELLVDHCPNLERFTAAGPTYRHGPCDLRLHQLPALRTVHLPNVSAFRWPAEELETYDEVTTLAMSHPGKDGAPWLRHFPGLVSLQTCGCLPGYGGCLPGYGGCLPGYGGCLPGYGGGLPGLSIHRILFSTSGILHHDNSHRPRSITSTYNSVLPEIRPPELECASNTAISLTIASTFSIVIVLRIISNPLPIPSLFGIPEYLPLHRFPSESNQSIFLLHRYHCSQCLHLLCLFLDFLCLLHPGYIILLFQPPIKCFLLRCL